MASKTITLLEDDLDGSEATQHITFSVGSTTYEIDLSDKNAAKFHKALAPYTEAARKVRGNGRSQHRSSAGNGSSVDTKAVRQWAERNGIELAKRGRIPADVLAKYKAASN